MEFWSKFTSEKPSVSLISVWRTGSKALNVCLEKRSPPRLDDNGIFPGNTKAQHKMRLIWGTAEDGGPAEGANGLRLSRVHSGRLLALARLRITKLVELGQLLLAQPWFCWRGTAG